MMKKKVREIGIEKEREREEEKRERIASDIQGGIWSGCGGSEISNDSVLGLKQGRRIDS